jgi:septum formation protein
VIILASRSPQRRGLLSALGVDHRVVVSDYGEPDIPGASPGELVLAHARGKARDVAARAGVPAGGAVLGSDTAVVIDGEVLGKPADRAEARRMLSRLSGRTHAVMTAVCLIDGRGEGAFVDRAEVTFRDLSGGQLDWYLDLGEWRGRAGGYAIQGAGTGLVRRIDGDHTTVVGLPVAELASELERRGLAPWCQGRAEPPGLR